MALNDGESPYDFVSRVSELDERELEGVIREFVAERGDIREDHRFGTVSGPRGTHARTRPETPKIFERLTL
jgi:hypothetical protein